MEVISITMMLVLSGLHGVFGSLGPNRLRLGL